MIGGFGFVVIDKCEFVYTDKEDKKFWGKSGKDLFVIFFLF